MNTNDPILLACLEGFVIESARREDLVRSEPGRRLVEALCALDACDDPAELAAVRHWYLAAWMGYAAWRGWTDDHVASRPTLVHRAA